MVAVEPQSTSAFYHFHGTRIDGLRRLVCTLLAAKDKPSLSKSEKTAIIQQIACVEEPYTTGDVNFSRVQSDDIRRLLAIGENLEFEALGPYLSDYLSYQGVISRDNLTPVDAIGLVVAASLRKIFPDALTVSFYDDYNPLAFSTAHFTPDTKVMFCRSLVSLMQSAGIIPPRPKAWKDYVLLSESNQVAHADKLVSMLAAHKKIERNGQEIFFVNSRAENPLHYRFCLRTKAGRWTCEALDAAAFLPQLHLQNIHLIVLPNYMKEQQDRVWELLRVIGIKPDHYHNIFFNPTANPTQVARQIEAYFSAVPDSAPKNSHAINN